MNHFAKRLVLAALTVGSLATAGMASASPRSADINWREANIERRIHDGMNRGDLTREEATRMQAELNDIKRVEAGYRHSGGLGGRARADLERRLDLLNHQLFGERHDSDRRH